MSDTTISIGLSPEEVLAALKQISTETTNLSKTIEDALGKKASQSINDLKDNAEKGSNQITKFFQNMGTRIREDLKTAFDVSSIMAGANFAKQIGQGVSQVFEMERAFDRLNVRLGLSARQMEDFRRSVGRTTSEAGVNIKDVQSGLMSAASRGGVKDPKQLTMIAASLSQARQINPDLDTGAVTDNIAEILKRQGQTMNGTNFKQTMDAINAATVNGGFKNNADAANHIAAIAPYAQQLGLDTRSMAGLAAVSSRAGESGESTLMQLLQQGTGVDRGARLNSLFGAEVFKDGKLDPQALAKVNTNQFGNISQQVLEQTTGIQGASGSDLKMFIDTWKQNLGSFDTVVKGTDETSKEFETATASWSAKVGIFKEKLKNAGQEIGDSVAEWATGLVNGDSNMKAKGIGDLTSSIGHNAGTLAAGSAIGLGASLLMGGGIRSLIGGAAAEAAGVQKVYVTNAAEIAAGEAAGGLLSKGLGGIKDFLGRDVMVGSAGGALAGGSLALAAGGVAAAGAAGFGIGKGINYLTGNTGQAGEWLYDKLHGSDTNSMGASPQQLAEVMKKAHLDALTEFNVNRPVNYTVPNSPPGKRGGR